ncbi:MAG: 16S rRNA methyltransferase [Euryarchaeota archaeon]|nr:16S rRNA methyltransferase [Euryarchaeota archaeon]
MLHLGLVDAELELVPKRLAGHPQVVEAARRFGSSPTKMLLDSSLHYAAMRDLDGGDRRGRPDLAHLFLLTALESIPNKLGQLRVFVHTRHDELIRIEPRTRLVRNYNRFCGLVQQLFERGAVGEPDPLLTLEKKRPLDDVLKATPHERLIVLDPAGAAKPPRELFSQRDEESDVVALIGGFPSGDYRSPIPAGAERVSIHPDALAVWTVAGEVLAHYPRTGPSLQRK